jgi:replicative DNA helicase
MVKGSNIIPIDLGKIPPQCIDIEEAILGGLMLERNAIDNINIKPEYFYKECHQKIFQAILNINKNYNTIDLLTVTEELKKLQWLEEIGGPYYISQLTSKVATASDIERYSFILTDKWLARELIKFSTNIQQLAFDDSIDISEIIDEANLELDKINTLSIGNDEPYSLSESLSQSMKDLNERVKLFKEGKSIGIPTPVLTLTRITGGWLNGKLIVIAARPSMGKTAFALSILRTAAESGYKPCIFSLEMDHVEITDRILVGHSGISADDFKFGSIQDLNWQQLEISISKLSKLNILIDDKPKSILKIKSRAKNLKRQNKCNLIIIDYLQLMESDENNKNREQEISIISRTTKRIARELEIPVILLSQLNREVEKRNNKKPQLSDLRESGAIEQDADIVGFLFRPGYYGITEDEKGIIPNGYAELIIAKHRGGKCLPVPFRFNDSLTEVYDLDYNKTIKQSNPNAFIESNNNFYNTPF